MSDSLWTPEIIATIVYRVIMVLVSLAFIWKQYRQQEPQLDEEQLIDILIRRQSFSPATSISSARQGDHRVDVRPAPRLREHFRANSNKILASAFGFDGTALAAELLQQMNRLPRSPSQMASNPSPEAGQMNVTPTIPPWSSSRLASDNRPNSESTLGEVRANTTPALASSSASRPLPTSNAAARLNEAKGTSKMIRLICASSSGKTSTAGHTIADDQEESVKL